MKKEYRVAGREYYAFCPLFSEDENEAYMAATANAAAKGAGLVVNGDGGYYVVAACYKTYAQADKVAEKNGGQTLRITIDDYVTRDEKEAKRVSERYEKAFSYADALIDYSLAAATRNSPTSCEIVEAVVSDYFNSTVDELCSGYADAESKARFLASKILVALSFGK